MAAAVNIAFEAPESRHVRTPSHERPIDLVYLATQTKGDKAVEIEILQMFARQARGCLQALSAKAGKTDIKAAAQRLRNAAISVGALRVASAADLVDSNGANPDTLATVASAVLEAEHFILKLAR
ncbi:MAG: Hpt domain-containing protein [Rhizobium sp.]|nr:Hpt domain-containing protein [Rhizobium sp.]